MKTKAGRVERYIYERLEEKGALMFMLVDPVDYKTPEAAIKTAKDASEGGADLILVGGSIGAQGELLDTVTKGIKDVVSSPVVLFPGNIATLTKYADAMYFMSLLNARSTYWITHAQMLSAPIVKHMGIEPLPVGYVVVSPGGTVGWVGDVNLVPREKSKIAAAPIMSSRYIGPTLRYLESSVIVFPPDSATRSSMGIMSSSSMSNTPLLSLLGNTYAALGRTSLSLYDTIL